MVGFDLAKSSKLRSAGEMSVYTTNLLSFNLSLNIQEIWESDKWYSCTSFHTLRPLCHRRDLKLIVQSAKCDDSTKLYQKEHSLFQILPSQAGWLQRYKTRSTKIQVWERSRTTECKWGLTAFTFPSDNQHVQQFKNSHNRQSGLKKVNPMNSKSHSVPRTLVADGNTVCTRPQVVVLWELESPSQIFTTTPNQPAFYGPSRSIFSCCGHPTDSHPHTFNSTPESTFIFFVSCCLKSFSDIIYAFS